MDRISPIYRLGGIRLGTEDDYDSNRARVGLDLRDDREARVGSSGAGGWRSGKRERGAMPRSHSFGEQSDYLKVLHSSYEDFGDTSMSDKDLNVRKNSVSIAQGDDHFDSEAASAANTPSSDLGDGPLADCNHKQPIYSKRGVKDRRPLHQQRHFPTSSYDVAETAEASTTIPLVLPRWGSELSLAKLSMGPAETPHPPSPHSPECGSSSSSHQPPQMSPAMRTPSRRSSQGDVSPCLHAVAVNGREGVQEFMLTPSYMHHRDTSPVHVSARSLAANRRETSPARGPPRRAWLQREGSPTRNGLVTRSFLHREGSPTRDVGCKKKKNLSPHRRRAPTSPRTRRTATTWHEKNWGSMSVLQSSQSLDDDLGLKAKEKFDLLKTFSLPQAHEPRKRQAQPVTRQPWPARDEERFAKGKAEMIGMDMNPFDFSSDDLCHLTLEIFLEMELPSRLGIPVDRLQRFILAVRDRMYENPYHNWMHVFDVTRTMYSLAHMSGVLGRLSDWERMGLITATLCHDLEHPGVNNLFLSKSSSALAKMYKDAQVLEKHHSLRAFELMVDDEVDLLRGLNTSKYYEYRTMVTRAIMATDMAKHADYVQKLEQIMEGTFVPDKQFEVELLIKSADTSNVLKPFDVAKRWAIRITDEFFLQGDLERQGGMEVTRMCDRDTQSRVGMQKGFIDFVIGPFFCKMEAVYPGIASCVDNMRSNRVTWDRYTDEMLLAEVDDQARYSFLPSPPVSSTSSFPAPQHVASY